MYTTSGILVNSIKAVLIIVVASFSLTSCYYHNEEEISGIPQCSDTADITYSTGVQPILSTNCYSCHSNAVSASLGSGVKLENYADVVTRAQNGSLVGTITHSGNYPHMPKGGSKLDDCTIQVIQKWVESGALNN